MFVNLRHIVELLTVSLDSCSFMPRVHGRLQYAIAIHCRGRTRGTHTTCFGENIHSTVRLRPDAKLQMITQPDPTIRLPLTIERLPVPLNSCSSMSRVHGRLQYFTAIHCRGKTRGAHIMYFGEISHSTLRLRPDAKLTNSHPTRPDPAI